MNTLKSIKAHLEFNGYEITKNHKDNEGFFAVSERYGHLSLNPIGESASIGFRLEKWYPIDINKHNLSKKKSLYAMVNDINMTLIIGSSYLYKEGGLGLTVSHLGEYNKKDFSRLLEVFHLDSEKMFDFDLNTYLDN